jgi:hypothetical protein
LAKKSTVAAPAKTPARRKISGPIGTLAESALHAALKRAYAGDDGEVEVRVDGYWIDARRADATLVEIQTAGFSQIKPKLNALLAAYRVLLVHPIAREKLLITVDADGVIVSKRKSPLRGRVEHVFKYLISLPDLVAHANLRIEVVLTREEETRIGIVPKKQRRWARTSRRVQRALVEIVERHTFETPADFGALLPGELPAAFTNADLARAAKLPRALVSRMTYCLKRMGVIVPVGKRGREVVFVRV